MGMVPRLVCSLHLKTTQQSHRAQQRKLPGDPGRSLELPRRRLPKFLPVQFLPRQAGNEPGVSLSTQLIYSAPRCPPNLVAAVRCCSTQSVFNAASQNVKDCCKMDIPQRIVYIGIHNRIGYGLISPIHPTLKPAGSRSPTSAYPYWAYPS